MKTILVLPVPMDNEECWGRFKAPVKRYLDSLLKFESGVSYELALVVNRPDNTEMYWKGQLELMEMAKGLASQYFVYTGGGQDIGSAQYFAGLQTENAFLVCTSSRVYAWKDGWLKKMVDARMEFGEGLYATMLSRERQRLHACSRCYGIDSDRFKMYSFKVNSHTPDGSHFECGELPGENGTFAWSWNLLEWFQRMKVTAKVVYQDRVLDIGDGRDAMAVENIYRRGDQSNLILKDWITDMYANGDDAARRTMESMCFGG
jgi:hypothetical protein